MQTAKTTTYPKTTKHFQIRRETGPRIRPLGDLLSDDTIKPRQQLCGPWLLERGFSMVFAPTGVGKSWFTMGVAAAVAGGGTFGHWSAPEPRRVLYIDGEMDVSDLKTRFQSIVGAAENANTKGIAENLLLYARHDQPEGDTSFPDFGEDDEADRIVKLVGGVRPQLVVLDNLSTLATVDDDNAAEAWDPFLKLLQRIKATGAAVLVVHHANKNGETYRGSSKTVVMFDALVRLRPDPRPCVMGGAAFLLDFTKTRMQTADSHKTFNVAFADDDWHWDTLVDPTTQELVRRILDGEFEKQGEAAAALGMAPGTVSKMLRRAYAAGVTTKAAIDAALQAARDDAKEAQEDAIGDHDDF